MNPLIEEIYRTHSVETAEGEKVDPFPTSVPYDEGLALYNYVRKEKAAATIEIGMAWGVSTLFICQAHADAGSGSHMAIDPYQSHPPVRSTGVRNIARAGLERYFTLIEAPSHQALPPMAARGDQADLVFVDGNHLFDYALVDFFYADMLLKPGGLMIFDDVWMPSVRKVAGFVLRNRSYERVDPVQAPPAPVWKRALRVAMNVFRSPFELDRSGLLLSGKYRFAVIRKTAGDARRWDYHRTF